MKYEWTSSVSGVPIWNIPVGDDGDANAWASAVIAAGGSVSAARLRIVGTLIQGLKADNIWLKFDRLWLLAAENQTSALIDLAARNSASAIGSPSFVANRGFQGEDLASPTKYINTGFNYTAGSFFLRDSAHHSVWMVTGSAQVNGGYACGAFKTSVATYNSDIIVPWNDGKFYGNCNIATGAETVYTVADFTRHWIVNRSGAASQEIYHNGSLMGGDVVASVAIQSVPAYLLCAYGDGSPVFGNSNQVAAHSIGGSLTSAQAAAFYSRLRDYMNAVGVP